LLAQAQVIQFVDEAQGFTYCPRSGHRILLATQSEQVAHLEQEQPVLRAEAAAAAERTVAATQLRRYLVEVAGRPGPLTVFISYPWGELFELILALHGLAPGLPALKELRESLASDRDR
jgi:hypothetical protein